MYTVYQHINKINKKIYIGITSQIPEDRWGHNGINYKSSPHFYNAILKYGWDNFEHIIFFTNLTREEACLKEQQLIKLYNSMDRNFGYNSTSGGENFVMNEETKQKISKAQKGRKLTEEHKQKLSEAAKKRHTPCSQKTKELISKSYPNKRKVYCEELDTVFESVHECARQIRAASAVSATCRGKCKTVKGYYDDVINV